MALGQVHLAAGIATSSERESERYLRRNATSGPAVAPIGATRIPDNNPAATRAAGLLLFPLSLAARSQFT
jgi:hypothetical protein